MVRLSFRSANSILRSEATKDLRWHRKGRPSKQRLRGATGDPEAASRLQDWTLGYPINPGGIPFIILPNFLAPKPLEKLRIIFFICRYCFRS
ncbi:MAG: hypothetical protein QOF63_3306 [Thermoanaerobaculia bacterium]|nr:hypothetical protein [Thermoanaerobaculia bacterium]